MAFVDNFDQASLDARWAGSSATLDDPNDRVDLSTGDLDSIAGVVNNLEFDILDLTYVPEVTALYSSGAVYCYIEKDGLSSGKGARVHIDRQSVGGGSDRIILSFKDSDFGTWSVAQTISGQNFSTNPTIRVQRNSSGQWTVSVNASAVITNEQEPVGITNETNMNTGLRFGNTSGGYLHSIITVGDETAPVLSLPTGTKTDDTTASGTVTTDESNGTLYYYATTNASETAATIKASGDSQTVTTTGLQNVSFTGLSPSTVYYAHYVQDDSESNESNVVSSTSFTTDAPSFTIVTPPASIVADTQASVVVNYSAVTPTAGNTEVKFDNDTGPAATVDSVTGSGPYTINFTFPKSTAKPFSGIGYPLYIEVGVESDISTAIPYSEPTGYDYTALVNPVTTAGSILAGYSGDAPVTGDQVVYTTPTSPSSITFTVEPDGEWVLDSAPVINQTVDRYVIQADGTVGTESTVTYTVAGDSVAPILTSPTGTSTGSTTGTGTVSTDEGNGTLYYYASTNSSEAATTIKASGNSQAVSSTGIQNVSFNGLTDGETYYAHYVHDDSSSNESNVVSSTSFTTGDATAPVLSLPTGAQSGENSATGTVTTDEDNGTLYHYVSLNAVETSATIKASGENQPVNAAGVQNVSYNGLNEGETYYYHFVQDDAAANESNVVSSASFTTPSLAPVLSSAKGASSGSTTGSGNVITNEGNGTLHYYASLNPTETAATIKTSGNSQIVASIGYQYVSFSGLTEGATYYAHYVQDDLATNESNVVSSDAFIPGTSTTTSNRDIVSPIVSNIVSNIVSEA